jgi:hypothetical protein
MRIFLWGPTQSGKTWLIDSFIRKVNLINNVLMERKAPYKIRVENSFGAEVEVQALKALPTESIQYEQYTFHRTIDETRINNSACSIEHHIEMLDGPGDETTGRLAQKSKTPKAIGLVKRAQTALMNADYLLVTVNPGIYGSNANSENGEKLNNPDEAGEHFLERLNALVKLKGRNPKQRVLLCFTKSDENDGGLAGFDAALAGLFSERSREIGVKLRKLMGENVDESDLFHVSAVGYFQDENGEKKLNYNPGLNKLIDVPKWNPHKVSDPLFKIFDEAQSNQIRTVDRPKGIFSRATLEKILLPDRENTYRACSLSVMMKGMEKEINRWLEGV